MTVSFFQVATVLMGRFFRIYARFPVITVGFTEDFKKRFSAEVLFDKVISIMIYRYAK